MNRRSALRFALRPAALVAVAALAAGCLPSSQRARTTAVTAADSLSRAVAAEAPVDSLALAWATGLTAVPLDLPTSAVWLPDALAARAGAALAVADTRRGVLVLLTAEGRPVREVALGTDAFPYLVGARGDSLAVFGRGGPRLDLVTLGSAGPSRDGDPRDGVARSIALPAGTAAALALPNGGAVAKRLPDDVEAASGAALVWLDAAGRTRTEVPLPGPAWRHVGFVRPWGGGVLSLSGYRPVVDVAAPGAARADSSLLVGFDSPQLVRSYRFLIGEVDEPPLLTPSAAVLADSAGGDGGRGERLLVLNVRLEGLRVDVYRRDGAGAAGAGGAFRLERVLAGPLPDFGSEMFPVDLAVREGPGGVELAVVLQNPGGLLAGPSGHVALYRWAPSGAAPARSR